MWRPRPCRWFELIAPREALAPLLEALGRAGAVELQTPERHAAPLDMSGALPLLARYRELARSSRAHWPPPRAAAFACDDPAALLAARVATLEAWRAEADPLITEDERLAARERELGAAASLLRVAGDALPDPALLGPTGRFVVDTRIWAGVSAEPASALPADVMQVGIAGRPPFVVLVGRTEALAALDAGFAARHAERVPWPAGLPSGRDAAAGVIDARRAAAGARRAAIAAALEGLAQRHDLAAALADIERIDWLVREGSSLEASERLVWISGWTTAIDERTFAAPLEALGAASVVHFPPPPAGAQAPSVLANPPWLRAFETFSRMLGQPAADEADPSVAVALFAPVLFGFMFGDVGQGLVLMAAGLMLRRRVPALVMLVPGGAMAVVFGLLFGSVFAREDLIAPLWLHPLSHPMALLAAALALGAALLGLGLVLNALQALWRHAGREWLAIDAPLALAYAGALAAAWQPQALWLVAAGAAWAIAGGAAVARGDGNARPPRLAAALAGLAQFVEHALQLAVNTVSFARVGAFALAHAGLSVAVTGLAFAAGGVGSWIVMLLGNLLILVLEGLVVGIQTTRLLLFEFFVRFLQGRGRAFRPLPPPPFPTVSITAT